MNGATVEIGPEMRVTTFRMGGNMCDNARQYKTVNLYRFSLDSWHEIERRLGYFVSEGRLNEYYEAVFAEMVADGTLAFDAVFFEPERWYEIDTMVDLCEAENLFGLTRSAANRSPIVTYPAVTHA